MDLEKYASADDVKLTLVPTKDFGEPTAGNAPTKCLALTDDVSFVPLIVISHIIILFVPSTDSNEIYQGKK